MNRALTVLFSLTLLALPAAALEITTETGATWAGNLSRTSYEPTAMSATIYRAGLAVTGSRQLAPSLLMSASADLGYEAVPKFDALNDWQAGLRLRLRYKYGLGPMVPMLDGVAGLSHHTIKEGGRSGWKLEGGLTLSKRLTETWRISAGASWQQFDADHAAFDVHDRRLSLETDWDVSEHWRLSAGLGWLRGRLTANAVGSVYAIALSGGFGPTISAYYSSIPWETSNTFGPGWVAYLIDCHAELWWMQLTYALDARNSFTARYEDAYVVNRVDVDYYSEFWSLGFSHRF